MEKCIDIPDFDDDLYDDPDDWEDDDPDDDWEDDDFDFSRGEF